MHMLKCLSDDMTVLETVVCMADQFNVNLPTLSYSMLSAKQCKRCIKLFLQCAHDVTLGTPLGVVLRHPLIISIIQSAMIGCG